MEASKYKIEIMKQNTKTNGDNEQTQRLFFKRANKVDKSQKINQEQKVK